MAKKHHVIAYCLDNQPTVDDFTSQLSQAGYTFETLGFAGDYSGEVLSKTLVKTNRQAILFITDNFLKSAACMYEIFDPIQRLVQENRLIPIVADGRYPDAGGGWITQPTLFERVSNVIQFMNHWQDQYLALRREKRLHESDSTLERKIEMARSISAEIGELLRFLRNQPHLTFDTLKTTRYEAFFKMTGDPFRFPPPAAEAASATQSASEDKEKSLVEFIEASGEELIKENPHLDSTAETAQENTPASPEVQEAQIHRSPNGQPLDNNTKNNKEQWQEKTHRQHVEDSESFLAGDEEAPPAGKPKTKTSGTPGSMPPKETTLDDLSELIGAPKDDLDAVLGKFFTAQNDEDKYEEEQDEPDVQGEVDIESLFEEEEDEFHGMMEKLLDDETVLIDFVAEEEEEGKEQSSILSETSAEEALEHAITFFNQGKKEAGLNYLRSAVEEKPSDSTLHYYYAYALARYGNDYIEAASQLVRLTNRIPNHADAWFLLGELAEITGEFPTARQRYEKVAALQPDYPGVYYRLGMLTLHNFDNEHEMAADFLRKAIGQDPENADAHYQLATLLWEYLNQSDKAIGHFHKVLELEPGHPFAHYDLALLYYKQGERQLAAKHYENATQVNPELKTPQNDVAFHWQATTAENETPEVPAEPSPEDFHSPEPEREQAPDAEQAKSAEDFDSSEPEPVAVEFPTDAAPDFENGKEMTTELPSSELTPESTSEAVGGITLEQELGATLPTIEEIIEKSVLDVSPTAGKEESPLEVHELVIDEILTPAQPQEAKAEAPQVELPAPGPAKTVLVSGATAGIGKATAEIFARNGFRVIATGRRQDRLEDLRTELSQLNGEQVLTLPFDVRDIQSVKAAIGNLPEAWQDIDILVNNAGLARGFAPIHEGDIQHWDEMIDTNLKGLLYLTRLVVPQMVKRRSGHIINVSSGAGKEVYPNGNVYCATKFAVDGLTRAMRLDLYQYNIRVSQVAPGHVEETEFARVRFDWDAERAARVYDNFQPLRATDVAEAIFFIATRPPHVNIQDVLMFGTQQAGSNFIDRSGR